MSFEKAVSYLREKGMEDRVIVPEASSATVELAAQAIGVTPGEIAKTLSLLTKEGPVLVIAEGTARVDNRKYKDTFHQKARMIPGDQVEELVGHAPGDESLRKYEIVYPAAGDDHSAVKLTVKELEELSGAIGWVDVCK